MFCKLNLGNFKSVVEIVIGDVMTVVDGNDKEKFGQNIDFVIKFRLKQSIEHVDEKRHLKYFPLVIMA